MCFKRVRKSDVIVRYGFYVTLMYLLLATILLLLKYVLVALMLYVIASLIVIYVWIRLKIINEIEKSLKYSSHE